MNRNLLFLLLICLNGSLAQAQKFGEHPENEEASNKGNAILLHLSFGAHLPGGDLADRFGPALGLGGGLEYLTEQNLILGAESNFYFGSEVKDDPLAILRNPDGDIIGNDRLIASVVLRQRAWYAGAVFGKLFTFNENRSGIRATLGVGWTQHKIRVQDDSKSVTQITGDYKKGYDRLTGGLALNEFLGWQHLANNRNANWSIGFELQQGFTQTLRDWDFNDRRKLDGKRLDFRFGLRATWTLPFYLKGASQIVY